MSTLLFSNLSRSSRLLRTYTIRGTASTITATPLRIQMSRSTIQKRALITETTTKTAQKVTPPCGDRCTCDYENEKNSRSKRYPDIIMIPILLYMSAKALIELYNIKTKCDNDDKDTASKSEASESISQ